MNDQELRQAQAQLPDGAKLVSVDREWGNGQDIHATARMRNGTEIKYRVGRETGQLKLQRI